MSRQLGIRFLLFASVVVLSYQVCAIAQHVPAAKRGSFLERAVEMNQFQIQLGQLARSKTQDGRVDDVALSTVRAAMQAIRRLHNAVAATASDAAVLTMEHQEMLQHLALLSGTDFDQEFLDAVTSEHRRIVRLIEQEAGFATGHQKKLLHTAPPRPGEMAVVARDLRPVFEQQLRESEGIQRELQRDAGSALLTH